MRLNFGYGHCMHSVARTLVVCTLPVCSDWVFVVSRRGDLSWRTKRAECSLGSLHSPQKVHYKVVSDAQKPVKQGQVADNSKIARMTAKFVHN